MLTTDDLGGILAMMPAFATEDAAELRNSHTVNIENLHIGVDRIVQDGIDVIATTGSFGEGYCLLDNEFEVITRETVDAVASRIPVFVGCVGPNPRASIGRIALAEQAGAEGILLGLPFYFPLSIENAVAFISEVSEMFPNLAFLIYHNPVLHRTHIPSDAFRRIGRLRNVLGLKDSHRETRSFLELMAIAPHLRVFVSARQYYPYALMGAAGMWSYDCWMGPSPLLKLREAVSKLATDESIEIIREISQAVEGNDRGDLRWRETAAKIAVGYAGYCEPGPLRSPYVHIPIEVDKAARAKAKAWAILESRYRGRLASTKEVSDRDISESQ